MYAYNHSAGVLIPALDHPQSQPRWQSHEPNAKAVIARGKHRARREPPRKWPR